MIRGRIISFYVSHVDQGLEHPRGNTRMTSRVLPADCTFAEVLQGPLLTPRCHFKTPISLLTEIARLANLRTSLILA